MLAMHLNETFTDTAASAIAAVMKLANFTGAPEDIHQVPILRKMTEKMMNAEKLVFILPAFPAKSPSPLKTSGVLPDLGEVLALQNLNNMCSEISAYYAPGAEVIICSDGRVFSDVVGVSDELITAYAEGIDEIIRDFGLSHLRTFAMDELLPELKGDELRTVLLRNFSMSIEAVREKARINPALFNGLHKFMVEDQLPLSTLSKNQLTKLMKERTYELMRRSDAWSALLEEKFGDVLRLSIHPYPLANEKFGVKLVTCSEKWATPWHNVTVRTERGFELMHKSRALELGAVEKKLGGKYVFFEL
ncbi:MAG: L-tyrosine/L-tryptophan isonitrile synthase family protein [Bacteriovoracaceae bacterium]